jgi:hypothetical protein
MDEPVEIWRDIPGWEGYYQVSSFGRVKSLSREMFNGFGFFLSKEIILNPSINTHGYYMVNLSNRSIRKSREIHSLMSIAFLNRNHLDENMVTNHIDGNKTNNKLENLEIVTHRQNNSTCFRKNESTFSSKCVGVYLRKKTNKWHTAIRVDGVKKWLGCFETEMEASNAYQEALRHIDSGTINLYLESIKPKRYSYHKGVTWDKSRNKWMSSIVINGKRKYLGRFSSELDAIKAYQIAIKKKILNDTHN